MDNIENSNATINGDEVTLTTETTISKDDYIAQLHGRLSSLNESKTHIEQQLSSVTEAIEAVEGKIEAIS